jgi:transposase
MIIYETRSYRAITRSYWRKKDKLRVQADTKSREWELMIDGKLLVRTSRKDMKALEVIRRYKELTDIERAFRTLKSSLEIRPIYHWTDRRIQAHVFICVVALQIGRGNEALVTRQWLECRNGDAKVISDKGGGRTPEGNSTDGSDKPDART